MHPGNKPESSCNWNKDGVCTKWYFIQYSTYAAAVICPFQQKEKVLCNNQHSVDWREREREREAHECDWWVCGSFAISQLNIAFVYWVSFGFACCRYVC